MMRNKYWLKYNIFKKSPLPWWERLTEKQTKEIYDHVISLCGANELPNPEAITRAFIKAMEAK